MDLEAQVEELVGERQQYLEIFEQALEAYVITAPDGTILDANGAAVDILQRRRRHLRGTSLAALVALDRRAEFRSRTAKPGSWSTVFEAPELRTDVTVSARLIGQAGGICWRLDPVGVQ